MKLKFLLIVLCIIGSVSACAVIIMNERLRLTVQPTEFECLLFGKSLLFFCSTEFKCLLFFALDFMAKEPSTSRKSKKKKLGPHNLQQLTV